jgi:integrase
LTFCCESGISDGKVARGKNRPSAREGAMVESSEREAQVSTGIIVDSPTAITDKASVMARRAEESTSATFNASLKLRGRQSVRAAVTGKARHGSEYTYRRAWVDFALFLRWKLGDGTLEEWINTDRNYRTAETDEQLAYLDKHIVDVKQSDIEDYRVHLLNKPVSRDVKGKPKVGLSKMTVNTRLAAVSKVLEAAEELGLRKDNPAKKIRRERNPPKPYKQQPLSARQVREIISSIGHVSPIDRRDWMLLTILARLGIRREEAANIIIGDFEDAPGDEGGWMLTVRGKGDKPRTLFVPRDLEVAIKGYVEGLELAGPLFPVIRKSGSVQKHLPLHPEDVTRIVRARAKTALGDVRCAPHALRATFATRYDEMGGAREYLQRDMGHSDPRTTEGYITSRLTRKRSATDVVNYEEEVD